MQNDIVKPPTPQPNQPPQPAPQPIGNEVHAAPKTSPSPQVSIAAHDTPVQKQPPDTLLSTAQKPRARKPLGVIIAAMIVFFSLGSGAIYVAMQDQKDTSPTVATTQAPPATPGTTSVADMNTEIDDALNEAAQLPTSNEDPASDLSDQTLGL